MAKKKVARNASSSAKPSEPDQTAPTKGETANLEAVGHADDLSFEDALADVQRIVRELESGDVPLDESLRQYEIGIRRLRACQRHLETAEQRIRVLVDIDDSGNAVTEELEEMSVRTGMGKRAAGRRTAQADVADPSDSAVQGDGEAGLF